jgi:hypothetical protein
VLASLFQLHIRSQSGARALPARRKLRYLTRENGSKM